MSDFRVVAPIIAWAILGTWAGTLLGIAAWWAWTGRVLR